MPTPQAPGSAPHPSGFTGVDWYARTTEHLAGDLLGGVGVRPLSVTAHETARLASAYGSAAVALDRVLDRLDGALHTGKHPGSDKHDRKKGPLPEYARWLARHAADLAEYAAKLTGHSAAYEVAARAMPSVADATRLRTDREQAQTAAATGGVDPALAALAGAAADSERAEQETHTGAAAVMVGFERAAEPLRAPWQLHAAPRTHLAKEREKRNTAKPAGKVGAHGAGAGGVGAAGAGGVAMAPLSTYVASTPGRDKSEPTKRAAAAQASSSTGRGFPMMPAGMLGHGAGSSNRTHQPAGAAPTNNEDELPEAFVVHSGPAVLGSQDQTDLVAEHL